MSLQLFFDTRDYLGAGGFGIVTLVRTLHEKLKGWPVNVSLVTHKFHAENNSNQLDAFIRNDDYVVKIFTNEGTYTQELMNLMAINSKVTLPYLHETYLAYELTGLQHTSLVWTTVEYGERVVTSKQIIGQKLFCILTKKMSPVTFKAPGRMDIEEYNQYAWNNMIEPLLKQLTTMHQYDISHFDIKPENTMVLNGYATFIDFGLSSKISDFPRRVRLSSGPKGTFGYISPVYLMLFGFDGLIGKDQLSFEDVYSSRHFHYFTYIRTAKDFFKKYYELKVSQHVENWKLDDHLRKIPVMNDYYSLALSLCAILEPLFPFTKQPNAISFYMKRFLFLRPDKYQFYTQQCLNRLYHRQRLLHQYTTDRGFREMEFPIEEMAEHSKNTHNKILETRIELLKDRVRTVQEQLAAMSGAQIYVERREAYAIELLELTELIKLYTRALRGGITTGGSHLKKVLGRYRKVFFKKDHGRVHFVKVKGQDIPLKTARLLEKKQRSNHSKDSLIDGRVHAEQPMHKNGNHKQQNSHKQKTAPSPSS